MQHLAENMWPIFQKHGGTRVCTLCWKHPTKYIWTCMDQAEVTTATYLNNFEKIVLDPVALLYQDFIEQDSKVMIQIVSFLFT